LEIFSKKIEKIVKSTLGKIHISQNYPNCFIEKNDKIAPKIKRNTALHSFKLQTCDWKYTHYRKGLEITPQLQIADLTRENS
jgi:hypothetical protein